MEKTTEILTPAQLATLRDPWGNNITMTGETRRQELAREYEGVPSALAFLAVCDRLIAAERERDAALSLISDEPQPTQSKPEYDATIGQLVCPHCDGDCGGFCEPGDNRYAGDD